MMSLSNWSFKRMPVMRSGEWCGRISVHGARRLSPIDPLCCQSSASASWHPDWPLRRRDPARNLIWLRKTVELAFGDLDIVQIPFASRHYTRCSAGLARPNYFFGAYKIRRKRARLRPLQFTHASDRLRYLATIALALGVVAMTSRMKFWPALLCIMGAQLATVPALAQSEHVNHATGENLGTVHFPISCSPEAQRQFDRAVAMLHSFYYPETIKAFTAISTTEPSCAMAYWGVAISQRPNPLVAPFPPEVLQQGFSAIEKARAAHAATQRQRDWIDALAVFFEDYDTVDPQ